MNELCSDISLANANTLLCRSLLSPRPEQLHFLEVFSTFNLGNVLKFSGTICPKQHFPETREISVSKKC